MRHPRASLLVALSLAIAASAAAAEEPPALLDAVARAPALEAARQRIDAARARAVAAGRLADPEIEAMNSRVNADAMGENRDMWELTVRQPLPRRGERAAERDRATAQITLAEADYALAAGEVAADVALLLAEAEGADARIRLLETQHARLAASLRSLELRLAAGNAVRLADRLSVQSRAASLQLALDEARRAAADARASARGRLGLPPVAPLPGFAAPAPSDINPAASPALGAAQARVAEATALGRMTRARANPMTSVGVRFERERSSMGFQDTLGFAVSSEFPFRSRHFARADARAAEADRAAALADATAARHRIASVLSRVERADRVAATARQLAAETQSRLDAEHETLNRAVSVNLGAGMTGDSAVLHAVDILDQSTGLQLRIIEADTAARLARAELWRHAPSARLLAGVGGPVPPG
jgi:cobalt-zinc-cadmium efflux system outer membrane protein